MTQVNQQSTILSYPSASSRRNQDTEISNRQATRHKSTFYLSASVTFFSCATSIHVCLHQGCIAAILRSFVEFQPENQILTNIEFVFSPVIHAELLTSDSYA